MNNLRSCLLREIGWRGGSAALALLTCATAVSAQQIGQAGGAGLPQSPTPQFQLAQVNTPGMPSPVQAGMASLTWGQVKAKFEAANPVLKSDQSNVDEMKAEEITAYLRPNPQFTMTIADIEGLVRGGESDSIEFKKSTGQLARSNRSSPNSPAIATLPALTRCRGGHRMPHEAE